MKAMWMQYMYRSKEKYLLDFVIFNEVNGIQLFGFRNQTITF